MIKTMLQTMRLTRLRVTSSSALVITLATLIYSAMAHSATPPSVPPGISQNPGLDPAAAERERLRRQQREEQKARMEENARQEKAEPQDKTGEEATPQGPTFVLKSVRFTKSEYLNRDQLSSVIEPWLGQEVTFTELQEMTGAINQLYREEGVYTAKAVLPQQRIENGIVMIRLIEGKLGDLKFEGQSYTDEDTLREWVDLDDDAKVIDIRALESSLLEYNRINDQLLQAELRAGDAFGLTDIVIQVQELERNRTEIGFDNYGFETNGQEELSLLYMRQKLLTSGDRGLGYLLYAEGSQSLSMSYNAPLGTSLFRLGTSLSYSETEVIEGDFKDLEVEGDSSRASIDMSYLAYSSPSFWINALASINTASSNTDVSSFALSKYETHQAQAGAEINWLSSQWQLFGRQLFSYVRSDDRLLSNDQSYNISSSLFTAIYNFDAPFYFLYDIEGQYTSTESINGSQAFSLGGPTTIRGYKPGFVSGDHGWYQQLEAHYTGIWGQSSSSDLYLFYDYGQVNSVNPLQHLASAGAGMSLQSDHGFTTEFSMAKALKKILPNQDDWTAFVRFTMQFNQ